MAAGGKILIIFNPTAIRPRPVMVMTDTGGLFHSLANPAVIPKNIFQRSPGINDIVNRNLGIWSTGALPAGSSIFNAVSQPVEPIFTQLDNRNAAKIRLVSAGIRIFKTSTAIAESGTIRLAYKPRGGIPQTSLDKMLETGPTQKYNVKVFPSQSV